MSDGEPHPTARNKILSYTFSPGDGGTADILDKSITTSRLVILRGLSSVDVAQIVVWDWTTGQILLVCRLLVYSSILMRTVRLGVGQPVLPVCEVY